MKTPPMKQSHEQQEAPDNTVNLSILGRCGESQEGDHKTATSPKAEPIEPPGKAHAPRERGGVAGNTSQSSATRPRVKMTEREIAAHVRRGFEKSLPLSSIIFRLQRWKPGNDKLIEDTAVAVWEFEERYGVTSFERAKRVDPTLTKEDWGS